MTSKIEQLIDEIEEYIDNCKNAPLLSGKILVNKEEIEELLSELRKQTPEEIKMLRKIISNKEAILNDAKAKAETLINDATVQTNQLISEHQIMQQAYSQADEVVGFATKQAQAILDNATLDANAVRESAMKYTDDILANMENVLAAALNSNEARYQETQAALNQFYQIVKDNREELIPSETLLDGAEGNSAPGNATGEINLDLI